MPASDRLPPPAFKTSRGAVLPSDAFPFESRYLDVSGSKIHYVEQGEGAPVVFFHGNPTSSYLWRNILPYGARHGRAIAFDLIGMGRSEKPALDYSLDDHYRYVESFLDAMDLGAFSLVMHDWGGPLGLTYALDHLDRVKSITLFETLIEPFRWSEMPARYWLAFRLFRFPPTGFLLNQVLNVFVRGILPGAIAPGFKLSREARRHYQAPYSTIASRKPTARWPREIPFSPGHRNYPKLVRIRDSLKTIGKPVLLLYARPGGIISAANRSRVLGYLPDDVEAVHVGRGIHYLQEAVPEAIGEALGGFLAKHHAG